MVSDEFLTRCIYALRCAPGQTTAERFIETVYGKGYRFIPPVTIFNNTDGSEENNKISVNKFISTERYNIALFPFEMKKEVISAILHDQLIEWLQAIRNNDNMPVNIISSFSSRTSQDYNKFLLAIEKSKADYFIVGAEVDYGERSIMRIDLVREKDHSVIHRDGVHLQDDYNMNYQEFCRIISSLLTLIMPGVAVSKKSVASLQAIMKGWGKIITYDATHFATDELSATFYS